MKKKWYLLLAVSTILLLATMPAWADPVTVAAPGTAISTNAVTFSVTVNAKVGINVDSGVTVNWTIDPATTTGWQAGVGSVVVRCFYNGSSTTHLRADNTGTNFPPASGLTVSNIRVTAAGAYSFGPTALTGGGVANLYDWAAGALNGWKQATHSYEYNVQGTEIGAAAPYTATIVYSVLADP